MMSKRILYLTPRIQNSASFAQIGRLYQQFANDYSIEVYSLCQSESKPVAPFKSLALRHEKFTVHSMAKLLHCIKMVRPDVVHIWNADEIAWTALACRLAKVKSICCSMDDIQLLKHNRWSFQNQCLSMSDCVLFPYPHSEAMPCSKLWRQKLKIVPSVISQERYSENKIELANRIGVASEGRLIGAFAEFETTKSLKHMIWGMELLRRVDESVYLLVIGKPKDSWRIHRYIRQTFNQPRVRILESHEEKPDWWIPNLDLIWTSNPNSFWVLKSILAKVAVIAAIDGSSEILNRDNCLVISRNDRAGFAKQTVKLLEDSKRADQLATSAQAAADNRLHPKAALDAYRQLYDQLP